MSEHKVYQGMMTFGAYGESEGVLFLSSLELPLADVLQEIGKKYATVRYWLSDEERTAEELQDEVRFQVSGMMDSVFSVHYSELTGYLWTDEEIKVGGHDLMEEFGITAEREYVNEGRWLLLEVELHDREEINVAQP